MNPRRHWRDHPLAFLKQKEQYAEERALCFYDIDFIFITIKLLQKDYMYLAKCLLPMGKQIDMSLEERAEMLKSWTKRFEKSSTKEE